MPQRARRFHHLIRPDDVVRHQFGEEVVAVVGRVAAREPGVVRRRGEVDDRCSRRSRPRGAHRRPRASPTTDCSGGKPGVGRTSKPMTWCPRATSSATAARPMRPADPVTRTSLRVLMETLYGIAAVLHLALHPTRILHEPPRLPGRRRREPSPSRATLAQRQQKDKRHASRSSIRTSTSGTSRVQARVVRPEDARRQDPRPQLHAEGIRRGDEGAERREGGVHGSGRRARAAAEGSRLRHRAVRERQDADVRRGRLGPAELRGVREVRRSSSRGTST